MKVQSAQSKKKRRRLTGDDFILHAMALPGFLALLIFSYIPMFGLIMAFQNMDFSKGIFGSPLIGLKNFEFLFRTQDAWRITRNTVCYNVAFIVVNMILAILLALLLSEMYSKFLAKTVQTIFIMPYFLSATVVSIIVFAFLSPTNGFVNKMLVQYFGWAPRHNWYSNISIWPGLFVLINAWKGVGYSAIVYLASISGISQEYYEAAMLDGASKFQQARFITIPHLRAMATILLIMNVGSIFRSDFGLFYSVTQNSGRLYPVSDVIDTYIYRALTTLNNTGMATAAGLYQSVVGCILVILSNKVVTMIEPDNALF